MAQGAMEEGAASSPIYTRRMQQALGFAPEEPGTGDVVTIFKGLQLDIGAPPQFMDFRYTVHDRWSGEFHLDHCGALMDVEPMGAAYVRRSEEHTSELQSLMRRSYAVFCLKKKK